MRLLRLSEVKTRLLFASTVVGVAFAANPELAPLGGDIFVACAVGLYSNAVNGSFLAPEFSFSLLLWINHKQAAES